MSKKDIRQDLHKLIDELDNDMLKDFYVVIRDFKKAKRKTGKDWWDELTEADKEDLLQGLEEVKHQYNLISHEETMKRARKWLSK